MESLCVCGCVRGAGSVLPGVFYPGFPPEPPGRNGAAAALTAQGWSRSGRPRLPLGGEERAAVCGPPPPPAPSLRSDHNNNNNGGGERGGRRAAGRGAAEEFGSFSPLFP